MQKNGGVFIKVGQHIGALDYLLPEEYVNTMKVNCIVHCTYQPLDTLTFHFYMPSYLHTRTPAPLPP